jgi:hypothetical protein
VNVRTLLKEVEKLEAEGLTRQRDIPADRLVFARSVGLEPDRWQERLLRSEAPRVLMNCARQTGKSTAAGLLTLHKAVTHPGALVLILALLSARPRSYSARWRCSTTF